MAISDDTLRDLLVEIKTKLDILLVRHDDHETRLRAVEQRPAPDHEKHLDHETRIRGLERARWIAQGAAALTGTIAGAAAGYLLG